MFLEQAIFTSCKTRRGQGYHVVAKSPGLTGEMVKSLNRWCPSHSSLLTPSLDESSLNFHPLTSSFFALSRTVYGGKEYSRRGGLEVATMVVVAARENFAGYDNHPLRLARVARALGHLRWQPSFAERLSPIELPDSEYSESIFCSDCSPGNHDSIINELIAGKSIALVAESDGIAWLEAAISGLPRERRLELHFATGLKWSKQRPFRLQLMKYIDQPTRLRMQQDGVRVWHAADLQRQVS